MSPATGRSRTFKVRLRESAEYEIVLRARSADAAEAKAERLWFEVGPDAFEYADGGLDWIISEEVRS